MFSQHEALDRLDQDGALAALVRIIVEVYDSNAARFDAAVDDNRTFATNVWRNITHRAVETFRPGAYPGVTAREAQSALEIGCEGLHGRPYKIPFSVPARVMDSVEAMTWDSSAAKLRGAVENSRTCEQLSLDGDPDHAEVFTGAGWDLRGHFRIVHTGDLLTGRCVVLAGIPRDNRDGGSPWMVPPVRLHDGFADEAGGAGGASPGPAPRPRTDVPAARYDQGEAPSLDDLLRPRRVDRPADREL